MYPKTSKYSEMKLKICGMKYSENITEVATLLPDYLGFIFYEKSPRNFKGAIPLLPENIKKVGVFVNASLETIQEKIHHYDLDVIQFHGEETPEFCKEIQKAHPKLELWKVFYIDINFSFEELFPYEKCVTHYLFDAKGKKKGGNGILFPWEILKNYTSKKLFILSGGIGLDEIDALDTLLKIKLPIHAIDVNSKFEISPGLKEYNKLEVLKNKINKLLLCKKVIIK